MCGIGSSNSAILILHLSFDSQLVVSSVKFCKIEMNKINKQGSAATLILTGRSQSRSIREEMASLHLKGGNLNIQDFP